MPAPEGDLADGVRLQLPEEGSSVVGRRGGLDYYVDRSLVRSPSVRGRRHRSAACRRRATPVPARTTRSAERSEGCIRPSVTSWHAADS
ncbi:hypothetical protein AB0I91_01745 [Actinosynnema sp. NPDC049800]